MRYPALRVIVVVQYVLAFVVGCVAWIAILGPAETYVKAGIVLGGVTAIVLLVGFAELLRVLMDIEENTRAPGALSAPAAGPIEGP